jgi:hypothetical protein
MTASSLTSADRRGERLARFRADLLAHIDRLTWDRARLQALQLDRLRALLRQAKLRSPFHAERLAEVDPDRVGLDDLAALPIMTKAEMMAAFDEVVADPRLSRSLVEAHLAATTTEPTELLGEYVVLASGGSSGERGVFVFDRHALVEYALGLTRTGLGRLLHLGAPRPAASPWPWSPPARPSTPAAPGPPCSPATCSRSPRSRSPCLCPRSWPASTTCSPSSCRAIPRSCCSWPASRRPAGCGSRHGR